MDLISRQDAIKAIKEDKIDLTNPNVGEVFKATVDFEKAETQVMTCDRHIKILKDLPPAQPEQECEKCIFKPFKQFQPEITEEQVREYCRKRGLSVIDSALLAKYVDGCQDTISGMPSAQPTDADIQRMQDTEQAMLEKAYECGKQDAMQWIPCSTALPKDEEEEVIVSIHDDSGDCALDYSSSGWYAAAGEFWVVDNEANMCVTAWMPLPHPYREVRE